MEDLKFVVFEKGKQRFFIFKFKEIDNERETLRSMDLKESDFINEGVETCGLYIDTKKFSLINGSFKGVQLFSCEDLY